MTNLDSAGVQPQLIQGIRSGDGVGDLFNYLFIKDIKSNNYAKRTGHETIDWFQIGKGVRQGCILSPCLFNLSSPSGERKDACGLRKWCKLLVLKFYWSPA